MAFLDRSSRSSPPGALLLLAVGSDTAP